MTLYNLHFVGGRLYDAHTFETEAGRHGIARAIPAFALKNLAWGDLILLASFRGREKTHLLADGKAACGSTSGDLEELGERVSCRRCKRTVGGTWPISPTGAAHAFGYTAVQGINLDGPAEAKVALIESLHVIRTEIPVGGGKTVQRECGSYTIGATHFVRERIREIVERAEAIERSYGVRFKFFFTGPFYPLAPNIDLDPVEFTRTIVRVDVEAWSPFETPATAETDGHALAFIRDYSSRRYKPVSPEERAAAIRSRVAAANAARRRRSAGVAG